MTTAQEVESTIDECNTAPVVNKYLRQYAEMIQKYEDAVAENVRLREAMNKYSEDEILLIERCAKLCEQIEDESRVKYKQDYSGYWEGSCDGAGNCVVEIRALARIEGGKNGG